jgi:hypothetical protein
LKVAGWQVVGYYSCNRYVLPAEREQQFWSELVLCGVTVLLRNNEVVTTKLIKLSVWKWMGGHRKLPQRYLNVWKLQFNYSIFIIHRQSIPYVGSTLDDFVIVTLTNSNREPVRVLVESEIIT